jgi:hypothetical protein
MLSAIDSVSWNNPRRKNTHERKYSEGAYQVEGKGEESDREYETDDANPGLQLFKGAFSHLAVHASRRVKSLRDYSTLQHAALDSPASVLIDSDSQHFAPTGHFNIMDHFDINKHLSTRLFAVNACFDSSDQRSKLILS